jgi:hypothetical protein
MQAWLEANGNKAEALGPKAQAGSPRVNLPQPGSIEIATAAPQRPKGRAAAKTDLETCASPRTRAVAREWLPGVWRRWAGHAARTERKVRTITIAGSRRALSRPRLRRLRGLSRRSPRPVWRPWLRRSGLTLGPRFAVAQHSIWDGEPLAHRGDQGEPGREVIGQRPRRRAHGLG